MHTLVSHSALPRFVGHENFQSSIAKKTIPILFSQGLDLDWCKNPDRGLPRPDVVFYLSISVDDALKRGDFGNERYEKADFQRKVKTIFEEKLMLADPQEKWLKVDAMQSIDEIHK
jgi:dTMP kinase